MRYGGVEKAGGAEAGYDGLIDEFLEFEDNSISPKVSKEQRRKIKEWFESPTI